MGLQARLPMLRRLNGYVDTLAGLLCMPSLDNATPVPRFTRSAWMHSRSPSRYASNPLPSWHYTAHPHNNMQVARTESSRREAAWRSARDRLDTELTHATAPSLGIPGETATGASAAPPTSGAAEVALSVMSTVVQRATAPLEATEEAVRRVATALAAKLGAHGPGEPGGGVPAVCWPGLPAPPAPARSHGLGRLLGEAVLGGWLWRFDPKRRLGSAWRRQWCFIAEGRLCFVSVATEGGGSGDSTDIASVDGAAGEAGAHAQATTARGGGTLGSIAGAAYALASSASAVAIHGYAASADDDRLPRKLEVRLAAELVTANVRYATLPPSTGSTQKPSGGASRAAPPPATAATRPKGFLSRAVAAASSYMRSPAPAPPSVDPRRASGGPMGGGQPIPTMGGGYPIPHALLLEQDGAPLAPALPAGPPEHGEETATFDDDPEDDAFAAPADHPAPASHSAAAPPPAAAKVHGDSTIAPLPTSDAAPGRAVSDAPSLPASYAVMHAFELRAPHETLVFATTTAAARRVWVETLKRLAESELTSSSRTGSKARGADVMAAGAPVSASLLQTASTSELVAALERFEAGSGALAQAAVLGANSTCSDCAAPSPDWVSLNLGCVFCLDCR